MTEKSVQLKSKKIPLDRLLLDPNNPRLAKSLDLRERVSDDGVVAAQPRIEALFVQRKGASAELDDEESSDGSIDISDLVNSMLKIGFVPVDQVVVRKLSGTEDKYLVIEGNRRVATAKHVSKLPVGRFDNDESQMQGVRSTLETLEVLVLESNGLSESELNHQIGVILGLRHFGQVLQWERLPRAVNIFTKYLELTPPQAAFRLETGRVTRVSTLLSEPRTSVLNALKTYVAFQQLKDAFSGQIQNAHYSLIEACVTNKKLEAHGFLASDDSTFEQDEKSLEQLNRICEFGTRDSVGEDKKILRDPKSVTKFASLVAEAKGHADTTVQGVATALLQRVLEREISLEDANGELRRFMSDRKWVESLETLLSKTLDPSEPPDAEGKKLHVRDFDADGNELIRLEEARKASRNFRLIFGC